MDGVMNPADIEAAEHLQHAHEEPKNFFKRFLPSTALAYSMTGFFMPFTFAADSSLKARKTMF